MTSLTELEHTALAKLSYGERVRAARDWFILLALAALVFAASAGWNFWMYRAVVHEADASATATLPAIDTDAVTKAEAAFAARAAEEARYAHTYPFVDPSK